MEQEGRMASTIGRRLSTLSSFYKYCQTEDILDKNPALNVRRPKVHDESRTLGLDRNELGALLVQAGLGDLARRRVDHAARVERVADLRSVERRHRRPVDRARASDVGDRAQGRQARHDSDRTTTGRALDLYIGERTMGPIFLGVEGGRMDRYCADRMVKRLVKRAGIDKRISPHSLRHSFITAALDAGVPLRDVQEAASPRRPANDDALRPGPTKPRSARHLHRVDVHRRSNPTGLTLDVCIRL